MGNPVQNIPNEIKKIIDLIIKGINLGETIVFCGAGISRNSGLPIVNQIVPYILEKFELPEKDIKLILDKNNNPKIPFEWFMQCLHLSCNLDEILNIYNKGVPNTYHILLSKLIKVGKVKTIVTTNFDRLIEKAMEMKPKAMIEGKDYDVIHKEQDFEKINWAEGRIRIIKIHGSIDYKEDIVIILKQIASQVLSKPRGTIIEQIFSNGNHSNVLVLGYSSSDVFDLSPQIEAIKLNHKKVYYVQHPNEISDSPKIENIQDQLEKNPFKEFKGSYRLYYNSDLLIKKIWESIIDKRDPYVLNTSITNWKENVDKWCQQAINDYGVAIRYIIPASIFLEIGFPETGIEYFEKAFKIAKKIGDRIMEETILGNLGCAYRSIGKFNKAIDYLENALKISKEIGYKRGEGINLGNLGSAYQSIGKYNKAMELCEQALNISIEISDREGEAKKLGKLGDIYYSLGEFNKAIEYNEQALTIVKNIGDKLTEMALLSNIGDISYKIGDFNNAKEFYEQALHIASEIGYGSQERELGNLGNCYRRLGEYNKAIDYLEQACTIAKNGKLSNEGAILYDLGNVYEDIGQYSKQIEYVEQSLNIAKKNGNLEEESSCLGSLGNAYAYLEEYSAAIEYYTQALKIVKKNGMKKEEGMLLSNLGNIYGRTGEFGKAIEYLKLSLNNAKKIGDREGEETCLGNLGTVYGSLEKYNTAIEFYKQSLNIAKEIGNREGEAKNLGNLGIIYNEIGEYKNAIKYFERALEIFRLVFEYDNSITKALEKYLHEAKSNI